MSNNTKTEYIDNIDIFTNDIDLYLQLFCEENNIDNIKTESQMVWNSCLRYIYNHVFKHNRDVLKSHTPIDNPNNSIKSTYNAYNYDLLMLIADYYIYDMCLKYNKEVSVIGFSALTGIDNEMIYTWGAGRNTTSPMSANVYKKLTAMREESLSNKLADGKQNPVGVIAILNRQFGWASPYTSDSNRQKQALDASQLPQLGESTAGSGPELPVIEVKND